MTGSPSEKRASLRIVNVYVLPSLETTGLRLREARAVGGLGTGPAYAMSVPQVGPPENTCAGVQNAGSIG